MFKGSLYGTSLQSLTLVIWGACRTLEGPGFEPLISKASECDSFGGEGTPEGIFRLDSKTTQGRESRAGLLLVVGYLPRFMRCGVGAPFQAVASGRRSGVGGG